MGQDIITVVCSFAPVPHLQAAVEAVLHLCISERNRPTSVWKRSSLTHAGLGKLNPGAVGLTSLINVWSLEAFFRQSMLHLYSTYYATLVPGWVRLFKSSSAAGTNKCLDLSCRICPPSRDRICSVCE